jgi:hypothetical protein
MWACPSLRYLSTSRRVFAAFSRTESVAHRQKFFLEDGLYHPLDRCLDNSVLDGGDAQGARLAARFGNFHAPHGLRSIAPFFKLFRQFVQVAPGIRCKSFDALPVYLQPRGLGLPRHGLSPCCLRAFTGALGGSPRPDAVEIAKVRKSGRAALLLLP